MSEQDFGLYGSSIATSNQRKAYGQNSTINHRTNKASASSISTKKLVIIYINVIFYKRFYIVVLLCEDKRFFNLLCNLLRKTVYFNMK